MSFGPLALLILLTSILLFGCSTVDTLKFSAEASADAAQTSLDKRLKARPAEGAGYVPMQQLAKDPKLPFNKAWIKPGADWRLYRTIYIAPVNTDSLCGPTGGRRPSVPTRCGKMSKTWRPSCGRNSSWPFRMIPAAACGW